MRTLFCLDTTNDVAVFNERNFACEDGRLLPSKVRCDHKIDCLNGEDEENCESSNKNN